MALLVLRLVVLVILVLVIVLVILVLVVVVVVVVVVVLVLVLVGVVVVGADKVRTSRTMPVSPGVDTSAKKHATLTVNIRYILRSYQSANGDYRNAPGRSGGFFA